MSANVTVTKMSLSLGPDKIRAFKYKCKRMETDVKQNNEKF